jgi:hypothetical protein
VTYDELVSGVLEQGGFDVSTAVAGGWVNEVHAKAVAESEWQQQSLPLGVTAIGVAQYAIPDAVVDIVGITLNDGSGVGQPSDWQRVSATELWDVQAGRRSLVGSGGVFAPAFSAVGEKRVELYPVPITAGVAIMALAAMAPAPMSSGMSPVIPSDMHGDLMDGAIALGLLRMDERADSAASFDARFREMVGKLRRRKNSRVGSRVSRIRVAGYDW